VEAKVPIPLSLFLARAFTMIIYNGTPPMNAKNAPHAQEQGGEAEGQNGQTEKKTDHGGRTRFDSIGIGF
jgi:hypothetical protein